MWKVRSGSHRTSACGQVRSCTGARGEVTQGWQPRFNVAPSQLNSVVVTADDQEKHLAMMKWGLVPATGYFEWGASPGAGAKQPYRVQVTDGDRDEDRIMAMAGLYDMWKGPYGEPLLTYTVITTEASPSIRALHERMPVILSREDEEVWLDPRMNNIRETEQLLSLLRPYPDTRISAYRVGRGVGSWASPNAGPANDRAELIKAA